MSQVFLGYVPQTGGLVSMDTPINPVFPNNINTESEREIQKEEKMLPFDHQRIWEVSGAESYIHFLGAPQMFRMSIHVCETASHIGGYPLQPERWLRIRKLEAQGPSNSYFFNAGKFAPQQAEGPSNS